MSNMVNRSEIENEENGKKLILKIYKKNSIYYIKVLAYLVNLQNIYIKSINVRRRLNAKLILHIKY